VLRWIDELNGVIDTSYQIREIRHEIKILKKDGNTTQNKREIKRLYAELDEVQFVPDYMFLVIDKEKDYYRACQGFTINGIKYRRLLGTNGGIKCSTIVFTSDRVTDELKRRINNDRDLSKKIVPAKLEAYKGLSCSASTPVTMPKGVLVVNDCETDFLSDITYISDENDGEPIIEFRPNQEIHLDASDGYGIMLPSLAERWSNELNLGYTMSGCNTRFSFEKGTVFTFDFLDFAENVAGKYLVTDAWGNQVDIRTVELVLTTSMVKLWDSYQNCNDYIAKSLNNGYTFAVTKICPEFLENERALNYQFIQSFDLDDDDINELIAPTIEEIKDVIGGDWRKSLLFLKGKHMTEKSFNGSSDVVAKALAIDSHLINDAYVQNHIYQMIHNRIDQAKIGAINVHGNYSIALGDPYALCQSIFELPVTGLLSAGEIYNQYWSNCGSERLVCFRAPMTCHANIRAVKPANNNKVNYWFRYIKTGTIFNAWDTSMAALNGMDFDGDIVMLTDNPILLKKHQPLPTLMCAQRKAESKIASEEDFIRSNIESFGNDIGQTTNWVTTMFEIRSRFNKESDEYKELTYRIQCGQLYQQNAIDKAKGIICKPMPKVWYDRYSVNKIEDESTKDLYRTISAEKKPYFMTYIYPALKKQYSTFISNTEKNSLREFGMSVSELKSVPRDLLTERQKEFIKYYDYKMPVGMSECVLNKICRKFESEFDGIISKKRVDRNFDYNILKSDAEYTPAQKRDIKRVYKDYIDITRCFMTRAETERLDKDYVVSERSRTNEWFKRKCDEICPDEKSLCNILIDICYEKNLSKLFVWTMVGEQIINNLLEHNGFKIRYLSKCEDGDVKYAGDNFRVHEFDVEKEITYDYTK
jgi:hypothetical protein